MSFLKRTNRISIDLRKQLHRSLQKRIPQDKSSGLHPFQSVGIVAQYACHCCFTYLFQLLYGEGTRLFSVLVPVSVTFVDKHDEKLSYRLKDIFVLTVSYILEHVA